MAKQKCRLPSRGWRCTAEAPAPGEDEHLSCPTKPAWWNVAGWLWMWGLLH